MSDFLTKNNFISITDHPTNVEIDKTIQIGNLDFYLCPKCATNTIRYASYRYNHLDSTVVLPEYRKGTNDYDIIRLTSSKITYEKERSDSIKVVVTRDPVERFVSAVAWYNFRYDCDLDIDYIIKQIPSNDIHFYPQSEFYGDPKKYDLIIRPDKIRKTILENTSVDMGEIHLGKNPATYEKADEKQIEIIKEIYKDDYANGYV
jgi:hypothetical protein|tara:strand:- start:163 stop:774 length:612 start_codon:yes stop_codon:yes gene_type:complete